MHALIVSCPTCLADNVGAQQAVNLGIWVLLGALGSVFLGIASVVFALYRRQRRLAHGLAVPTSF